MASGATKFYDAIVDAAGGGDYTTIADAITDNMRTILVKSGTYATFTQDQAQSKIYFEPATVITGDANRTGSNASFVFGACCDVQGELDITTGTGCYTKFENGCTAVGIDSNTDRNYIDGGGWGTLIDGASTQEAIDIDGDDNIIENISANTNTGSGNSTFTNGGARNIVSNCKVVDSGSAGIGNGGLSSDGLTIGCIVLDADDLGISANGPRTRLIGNRVVAAADEGIYCFDTGDDSVVYGNIVKGGTDSVQISGVCENNVVVGNRLDGGVNDASGTSTVANNDETAF